MADKQDAPTAVVVVDPDGTVSGWSEGGRLLLGWTAEDTVGRPVTDLLVDHAPPGFPEGYGTGPDPTGWRRRRSSPNWSSASWSPTPSGTASRRSGSG